MKLKLRRLSIGTKKFACIYPSFLISELHISEFYCISIDADAGVCVVIDNGVSTDTEVNHSGVSICTDAGVNNGNSVSAGINVWVNICTDAGVNIGIDICVSVGIDVSVGILVFVLVLMLVLALILMLVIVLVFDADRPIPIRATYQGEQ